MLRRRASFVDIHAILSMDKCQATHQMALIWLDILPKKQVNIAAEITYESTN
jgi:hypothetical protein